MDGLLEASAAKQSAEDERRIYYRLSTFGRRVLAAEMLRLRELVHLAEQRGIIAPLRA
jgi:DNA-binding PadR family transcriptional regulator